MRSPLTIPKHKIVATILVEIIFIVCCIHGLRDYMVNILVTWTLRCDGAEAQHIGNIQ